MLHPKAGNTADGMVPAFNRHIQFVKEGSFKVRRQRYVYDARIAHYFYLIPSAADQESASRLFYNKEGLKFFRPNYCKRREKKYLF